MVFFLASLSGQIRETLAVRTWALAAFGSRLDLVTVPHSTSWSQKCMLGDPFLWYCLNHNARFSQVRPVCCFFCKYNLTGQ